MSTNPYQASQITPPPPEVPAKGKDPFSMQAAKFSLYAPFVLMLVSFVVGRMMEDNNNQQNGSALMVHLVWGGIQFLTVCAAFIFGGVGLVGGIQRRSGWTIATAIGGLLLNGLILGVSALAIFYLVTRA